MAVLALCFIIFLFARACLYMHVGVCACICVYVRACGCERVYMHVCMCMHVGVCTCIHGGQRITCGFQFSAFTMWFLGLNSGPRALGGKHFSPLSCLASLLLVLDDERILNRIIFQFTYLLLHAGLRLPQHTGGGQRTNLRRWFPPPSRSSGNQTRVSGLWSNAFSS